MARGLGYFFSRPSGADAHERYQLNVETPGAGGVPSGSACQPHCRHSLRRCRRHYWMPTGCYGVFMGANQQTFFWDRLEVRVFGDRGVAGAAGAETAAGGMREEIGGAGRSAVVFASAVSQDPFLAALRA